MRFRTLSFLGVGFIFLFLCVTSSSQARVSVGISIGTSFGHGYPGYYHGYHPYYPWSSRYYTWLDRDRYGWWDTGWYGHYPRRRYSPGHSRSSSLGIWIGNCYPAVVDVPIVVDCTPTVKVRTQTITAQEAAVDAQRREAMRKKKSEQLKILRTGDKERRIQAIHELAEFSFDNGIRRALEGILLSDPDPEMRKEVAVSFGKTENRLVLAVLTEAKEKDPVRDVRQAAYRSIIMIKGY